MKRPTMAAACAEIYEVLFARCPALAPCRDVAIRVPETETYRVQELHLPVYHALCAMLEAELF